MANIITATKKFMLYNKRQHLQHTVPRPLQIKVIGHAFTEQEWQKFVEKYLTPIKVDYFCERRGHGDLVFFGEGGVEAATVLQKKFPDRFHFVMEARNKTTATIGLTLAKAAGLKVLEVSYKDSRNHVHHINEPTLLETLAEEGKQELTEKNIKLA